MNIKGFTLVELMVVMAIIAFLSVGAYGGLTFALRQGRDSQRTGIVNNIQLALQSYYADFQAYPGCGYTQGTSATKFSGGTQSTGPGIDDLYYCSGAFDKGSGSLVSTTGEGGLAGYFEGEFAWGAFSTVNTDQELRYYYIKRPDGTGSKFTVCADLENTLGGNTVRKDGKKTKDCYCVGANQSDVACFGMGDR